MKFCEQAGSKQLASKKCAFSFIQQLFQVGLLEQCGSGPEKPKSNEVPVRHIKMNDHFVHRMKHALLSYGIEPVAVSEQNYEENIDLILKNSKIGDFETSKSPREENNPQVITWSPPFPGWDTWRGITINDGKTSMVQISRQLQQQLQRKRGQFDDEIRKLPVFEKKNEILQAVANNVVCMVRGETGSGKTTQVPQYLLDDAILRGHGAHCNIVVTQPRRISAVRFPLFKLLKFVQSYKTFR